MREVLVRSAALRYYFKPILEEWTQIVTQYTEREMPKDALYWYNERATLSTLAAAIARKKHPLLEEYRTEKGRGHNSWAGRADIWFKCGEKAYVGEAKQLWISITRGASLAKVKVNSTLRGARSEAIDSKYLGAKGLGIVFVVPYIAKSKNGDASYLINEFKKAIYQIDCDASAIAFPHNAETTNEEGYFYPGVACCIRLSRRS